MRILPRLTYANVMATIAVFIALGGASYAATRLPESSVGSKQLKNNAVISAKIKNGAVTPAKLNGESKAALIGPAGPQGPQGSQGSQGLQGPRGLPGAAATALWAVVNASGEVVNGTAVSAEATGAGTYEVKFAQNVSACATIATSREVSTKMRAELSNHDPASVNILMESGGFHEFSLAVFC